MIVFIYKSYFFFAFFSFGAVTTPEKLPPVPPSNCLDSFLQVSPPEGKLTFEAREGRSGKWFVDEKEKRWYAKPDEIHTELQTGAEVVSALIYRKLGYNVPDALIREIDGVRHVLTSEVGQGAERDPQLARTDSAQARQLRFLAAFLKDWDRTHGINNFSSADGRITLIDFGGTLGSRARGQHKPGQVFSKSIGTFEATKALSEIYDAFDISQLPVDHPWRSVTRSDAEAVVEKLKTLTDTDIDAIVRRAQYKSPADESYLAHALKTRRDGLIENLLTRFPKQVVRDEPASRNATSVSSAEFGKRVFAVHATEFFPKGGVMIAGASDISGPTATVESEPASFRPTVHFSLGGLVRDHGAFSWEKKPYAVVVPIESMKEQIINLSPSDTFVLGDFSIPKGAVVLIPKGTALERPAGIQVVEYDPKTSTLRKAIDQVIDSKGGWKLDLPIGKPGFDAVVKMRGEVVDFNRIARHFVNDNPHISFGDHLHSVRGFAGRLGIVEQTVNMLGKQYQKWGRAEGTAAVVFLRSFINHQLHELHFELREAGFPERSMNTYREKRKKLEGWLNLIDADLKLRRGIGGLTFAGTGALAENLSFLRNEPEKLNATIDKIHGSKLRSVPDREISSSVAAEWLAGNKPEEFRTLAALLRTSGGMTPTESANLRNIYALKRTLLIGLEAAREEGLLDMLAANLDPLRPTSYGDRLMDVLSVELGHYLDTDSTQLETALAVLQLPAMRSAFMTAYGVSIPEGQRLTLEEYLRLHPETKAAFEPVTTLDVSPVTLKILNGLERVNRGTRRSRRLPTQSFTAARSRALDVEYIAESTAQDANTLNTPMRSARDLDSVLPGEMLTLYEMMQRGDFGKKPQEIWNKLGLGAEYRLEFENDTDFWKSDKSFQEIYEILVRRKGR